MAAEGTNAPAGSDRGSLGQLYAGFLIVTLIAMGVAVWALMHLRQEAEDRVVVTTQNLAVSLEKTIEGMIDTIDVAERAAAYEIARQISIGKPDAKTITGYLVMQTEPLRNVGFMRATNARGDVIYGKVILSPPSNSSDRDYFSGVRDSPETGLFIDKPTMSRIDKKWSWPFSRRINTSDGSFGGVVFASVFVEDIEKMFAQLRMGSDSVIVLRDANLGLVARKAFGSQSPVPIGDKKLSTPFKEALKINPEQGTYIADTTVADGFSRWYSYRRNAKYGFTILVGVPINGVVAEWKSEAAFVAGILAVFILASLAYVRQVRTAWLAQEQNRADLTKLNAELVQRELQVRQLAFYDPLTNLPNRRLLSDRLAQTMAVSKRSGNYCALLFLDLDNFKPLNDQCGHRVGDLLLMEVADRIRSCVREIDTVARLGGDEFVVVISDVGDEGPQSIAQANVVAEKILSLLAQPYLLQVKHHGEEEKTVEHRCSVSIGIALFLNHELSEKDLIARADKAMYQAKLAGRNAVRIWE